MRISFCNSVLLLLSVGYGSQALAQDGGHTLQPVPPVRDPQALQLLAASITVLGGQNAIAGIWDVTVTGTSQSVGGDSSQSNIVWLSSGSSIRKTSSDGNGTTVLVAQQGKAQATSTSGDTQSISGRTAVSLFPFEAPGVMLLMILNDPSRSAAIIADGSGSPGMLHLRTTQTAQLAGYVPVTQQDWYFDPNTGFPVRVDFVIPDQKQPALDSTGSILYGAWQSASGVQFPQLMQLQTAAGDQSVITVSAIALNQGLDPTLFQVM